MILGAARSTGSLILATLGTALGLNIIAGDQYISIVVPGRMYRAEFEKRGLHPKNLSRALEDSGHAHLCVNSLEYVWCVYGGHPWRTYTILLAVLLSSITPIRLSVLFTGSLDSQ